MQPAREGLTAIRRNGLKNSLAAAVDDASANGRTARPLNRHDDAPDRTFR